MNITKDTFQGLFQKSLSLFHIHTVAGGLEVSDEVIRLVYFDGKKWNMAAIRLAPGIMLEGRIKDVAALKASLLNLRAKIAAKGLGKKKKMSVVVSLSSAAIYSQTFTLPLVEGPDLAKAVELNVQMSAPSDIAQLYSGSELLGRDEESLRLDFSASYIDRTIINEMAEVLLDAGFIAVAVEPRARSLLRIIREKGSGIDTGKSYILLNIDNSGMEFLIVRKGMLYFEYSNKWTNIADGKGQITMAAFEESLAADLRKVLNFYSQHWHEPLGAVILSVSAFKEGAERAIAGCTDLPIIQLALFMGQPVSSEWLVALGCNLRGLRFGPMDKEINLLGEEASDAFREEQLYSFVSFWRILIPLAFCLLLIAYGTALWFISNTQADVAAQAKVAFKSDPDQMQQIAALQASSTAFNQMVAVVGTAESQQKPLYALIQKVNDAATANNITISEISLPVGGQASVSGSAGSSDVIFTFKDFVEKNMAMGAVIMPLSNVRQNGNIFTFSMTFQVAPGVFVRGSAAPTVPLAIPSAASTTSSTSTSK